jgi:3-dehydroquinate dehydratase/shikimate dehydrogenase
MPQRNLLPRICVALGSSSPEELLAHARREAEAGEKFLEFRLDHLDRPEGGVPAIRAFLKGNPECRVLATCRRHQNHGKFNGSIEDQIAILDAAVEAGAEAVDIEIESAEDAPAKLEIFRGRARLVLSYHNFETTPATETIFRRLSRIPADIYKIVTTARKPSDNHRVLALARAHAREQTVVLAMGEIGFPSRVLAPVFGACYTYAAPCSTEGTASGQVSAKLLRQLYRIDKLSRSAKIYGVIADPIRHSISPAVHNRAFQSRRIEAVYLPFRVQPSQLKDFLALAEQLPVAGFSVTIPHKQKILRYLDVVDPLARRIGAVNTVWRKAGKWRGANTDVEGLLVPLARRLRLPKASILLVGNGGAARSAAFALVEAGARVSIVGRNPDRVRALAKASGAEPLVEHPDMEGRHFDALVHGTPLGMFPNADECFFPGRIPADVVFDMVYNPLETVLIRRAREQGCQVVPGIQMFLEQAARQFEIWTGDAAPRGAMEKAAVEALAQQSGRPSAPNDGPITTASCLLKDALF